MGQFVVVMVVSVGVFDYLDVGVSESDMMMFGERKGERREGRES